MQTDRITTKIGEMGEEEYLRIFYPEAQYLFKYLDEMRSISNDRALNIIDAVSRERDLIKRIYNMYKGKVIVIEAGEDLRKCNIWLEWKTEGIVYSRVLGKKKSYRFNIKIPPVVVCDGNICKNIDFENMYPTFEVAMDFVDVYVKKEDKHVRRFWEKKGKITIFLVIEDVHTLERKKYKLGEIEIIWVSHEQIDRLARKRVHKIRNIIRKLKERYERSTGSEKARIKREIKKLEIKLERELKKTHRQWLGGLAVRGKIGDIEINRILLKPKLPKSRKKKRKKYPDALAVATIKDNNVTSERWGIRIASREELRKIIENGKLKHVFTVGKRASFYGKYGKMNHEIRILGIPRRKIKVEILAHVRESVWRKFVKINRHPVKIYEYISNDSNGLFNEGKKIWVVEPVDNVARFEIINRDHAGEAMDRIMVHLEKGQYLVFYHEL